jgi:ATP-binding cassette, subfamily A (ABC1), member 3
MSGGELKAFDTPFNLKKKFGAGYRLVCVKENSNSRSENVESLIQNFIPDVQKASEIGTELTYLLRDEHDEKFQEMFEELEEKSSDLGIANFGMSCSNLEEVMLK